MSRRFGASLLAMPLLFGAPAAVAPTTAASANLVAELTASPTATDVSARRRNRGAHSTDADRQPSHPHYYERPYFYRPYPYSVPVPFVFGFGPWWW